MHIVRQAEERAEQMEKPQHEKRTAARSKQKRFFKKLFFLFSRARGPRKLHNMNIYLIVGAAAAYLLYRGGEVLNKLTYRINKTSFDKFNINEIVIKSNITVFNRSSSNLKLVQFTGTLFYKEQPAAIITSPINKTLERKGRADIDIYFNINPLNFFNQLTLLIASGNIFGNFKVVGTLQTEGFNVPINYTPDILPN